MATVPVMRTWVTGEVVTAAYLNSNLRDASNFLLAPPLAVLRQSSTQSVPNAAYTAILLDAEDIDRDSGHSTVTNTSKYVCQTPGWYSDQATLSYASNATGLRIAGFNVNGVDINRSQQVPTVSTGGSATVLTTTCTVYLNALDNIELHGYQTSGGALLCSNGRQQIRWVST